MRLWTRKKRETIGALEWVAIPSLGVEKVLAKVDTGAYNGALHCENLTMVKQGGEAILRFSPVDADHEIIETKDFKITSVVGATGHKIQRYIVPIELELQGKTYKTHIGLSDRKELRRPMLLGRKFIRKNRLLVDVSRNVSLDDQETTV